MQIKHILGVTALALAGHVGATTIDWGDHGPLELAVGAAPTGNFTDTIDFTLMDATPLAVTAVSNNLGSLLDITDGTISLYEHGSDGSVLLGSYDFNGTTGDLSRIFTPMEAGSYFYSIKGTGTGTNGGLYSITSAPVPEPKAWALTLSAVLLLGAIYQRKKHR